MAEEGGPPMGGSGDKSDSPKADRKKQLKNEHMMIAVGVVGLILTVMLLRKSKANSASASSSGASQQSILAAEQSAAMQQQLQDQAMYANMGAGSYGYQGYGYAGTGMGTDPYQSLLEQYLSGYTGGLAPGNTSTSGSSGSTPPPGPSDVTTTNNYTTTNNTSTTNNSTTNNNTYNDYPSGPSGTIAPPTHTSQIARASAPVRAVSGTKGAQYRTSTGRIAF